MADNGATRAPIPEHLEHRIRMPDGRTVAVVITHHMVNCLEPGVDGWVDDDIAFTKPRGFDVASIRVPVYLTYGRADTLVPAAHGDWLAAHIADAEVHVTDVGHMGDDASVEGEMAWLAGGRPSPSP